MAKLSAVIFHKNKPDTNGNWDVQIRIAQKGEKAHINTKIKIGKKDLDSKFKIRQTFLSKHISPILNDYENRVLPMWHQECSALEIKERLNKPIEEGVKLEDTDFINFCFRYIGTLIADGKYNSTIPLVTVANSLNDFVNSGSLFAKEITSDFLKRYESYLRKERIIKRQNQFEKIVTTKSKGLSDAGVFKHMANLRLLFNKCKDFFNDYDLGLIVIPNNPFVRYKIKSVRSDKKRSLTIKEMVTLYNLEPCGEREKLAKDMFFLSFFLCGINSVDLYNYNDKLVLSEGRLGYNRSKTKDKRMDKAFISLNVPEVALCLLKKYKNKLKRRYVNDRTFCSALNKGLGSLSKRAGLGNITFYFARHTFATIARNDCKCSKDDIAEALNHVDTNLRVTDNYIAKDWKIVDDVQEKVLKFFFDKVDELGQFALNAQ